jgi:hypothetical protein
MRNRVRTRSGTIVLAVALPLVVMIAACDRATDERVASLADLRLLVDGYAHAIETNNRELASSYVHPSSPWRSDLDTALRNQLAAYFERARTSDLEPIQRSHNLISAKVDQEIVRVSGMKFMRAKRQSIYEFRPFGKSWRIWGIGEIVAQ